MKTPLSFALLAIILFVVLWVVWPVDRSDELKKAQENEAILLDSIQTIQKARNSLLERVKSDSIKHTLEMDSAIQAAKKTARTGRIYQEARHATETDSTVENVAAELGAARTHIDTQETHINALLELNSAADSLIKSQRELIANQESELMVWPKRLQNLKARHEAELKQERRKGNRKFFKGAALGAIAVLVLVLV